MPCQAVPLCCAMLGCVVLTCAVLVGASRFFKSEVLSQAAWVWGALSPTPNHNPLLRWLCCPWVPVELVAGV